jgi:hypothetical protein
MAMGAGVGLDMVALGVVMWIVSDGGEVEMPMNFRCGMISVLVGELLCVLFHEMRLCCVRH